MDCLRVFTPVNRGSSSPWVELLVVIVLLVFAMNAVGQAPTAPTGAPAHPEQLNQG